MRLSHLQPQYARNGRPPHSQRVTRQWSSCSLQAQAAQSTAVTTSVLEWASGKREHELACEIGYIGASNLRGLVAKTDILPGRTILSVPYDRVYTSQPEDELEVHWSAEMAVRLLKDRHAGSSNQWCTWLDSLPKHVVTPLEFGDSALEAVRDPLVRDEVVKMQDCMGACYEELQPELEPLGCTWEDFLGAVQLLHSRCFFSEGLHLAVPGVDLCNHSPTPTARVEVQHSPGAVQGLSALEEVSDPATWDAAVTEPSRFSLVAGAAGLRAGQEITISYGDFPDTAFFLLFGFLPQDNPHNSVVIFEDVHQLSTVLVCHLVDKALQAGSDVDSDRMQVAHQVLQCLDLGAALQQLHSAQSAQAPQAVEGYQPPIFANLARLVVTRDGWDARTEAAVRVACAAIDGACGQASQAPDDDTLADVLASVHNAVKPVCSGAGSSTWAAATSAMAVRDLMKGVVVTGCRDKLEVLRGPVQGGPSPAGQGDVQKQCYNLAQQFTERQVLVLQEALGKLGGVS